MVTSRSNKKTEEWVAGAFVFSGRRDPTWTVDKKTVKQLEKIWDSLESLKEKTLSAPSLGYRGCFLRSIDNREWFVYNEVVTLKIGDSSKSRFDKNRMFEKLLLKSAPEGLLPPQFFEGY